MLIARRITYMAATAVLALVGSAAAGGPSAVASNGAWTCGPNAACPVPISAEGRPAFAHPKQEPNRGKPGVGSGYYIWHDDHDGWHLRTADLRPDSGDRFRAMITIPSGQFYVVKGFDNETMPGQSGRDWWQLAGCARNTYCSRSTALSLRFETDYAVDGLDFRVHSSHITFSLQIDSMPASVTEITLGGASMHPASNTFTFDFSSPASSAVAAATAGSSGGVRTLHGVRHLGLRMHSSAGRLHPLHLLASHR